MKIMFFGSSGPFSLIPLKYLLQSDYQLCGIVYETFLKAPQKDLRYPIIASDNESLEMIACMSDIPAIQLVSNNSVVTDKVKAFAPDIIIVSCLSSKLPESILRIPPLGCFNLHPSLLPVFRGPVPLFWQFREGVEEFGMTLHRMDSSFDSGPIIGQNKLTLSDGITNQQASEHLADKGLELLQQYLEKIVRNEVEEQTQDESKASYMSYPYDSDFVVSTTWTAKRMYNFICATRHWNKTYPCEVGGHIYHVIEAISYRVTAGSESLFSVNEDIMTIPCSDGLVTARFDPDIPLTI